MMGKLAAVQEDPLVRQHEYLGQLMALAEAWQEKAREADTLTDWLDANETGQQTQGLGNLR